MHNSNEKLSYLPAMEDGPLAVVRAVVPAGTAHWVIRDAAVILDALIDVKAQRRPVADDGRQRVRRRDVGAVGVRGHCCCCCCLQVGPRGDNDEEEAEELGDHLE